VLIPCLSSSIIVRVGIIVIKQLRAKNNPIIVNAILGFFINLFIFELLYRAFTSSIVPILVVALFERSYDDSESLFAF